MATPAEESAAIISSRCGAGTIDSVLLLDENFCGFAELGERVAAIPYGDLPGFPTCAGAGEGEFILADVEGAPTAILKGRPSFHETGDPSLMTTAIECLSLLGARAALCLGLARSTQPHFSPGSVVMVADHINFTGLNPLIGAAGGDAAMVDMTDAYDKRLLRRMKIAAGVGGGSYHEGVLMWFSGPSFETPAEMKVARQLGADLVGWTIAPEAILARRFGLPFGALAVVEPTSGGPGAEASPAGVIAAKRLVRAFLKIR